MSAPPAPSSSPLTTQLALPGILPPRLVITRQRGGPILIRLAEPAEPYRVREPLGPPVVVAEGPRRRARQRHPLPAPIAPAAEDLRALEYVVVDVETTGGSSAHGHRVTEFAAVCVSFDGTVIDEYSSLVNPDRSIPPFISALTNITGDMVRDAPRFRDIAAEVERMLAGRVFVAHNAAFDWRFTCHELERARGVAPLAPVLCTVRLARRVLPELGARSLDALTYYFGLENTARHRAGGDARVTAAILARMLGRLEEHEVTSWSALQEFLRRRKPRRPRGRQATPVSMDPADLRPQ